MIFNCISSSFVPKMNLTFNLFSVTTVSDKAYTQYTNTEKSIILKNDKPVLIAKRHGDLFQIKFCRNTKHSLSAVSI